MNIFVGNLPFEAADADVRDLFERFGHVTLAVIALESEKKAPKSRGFGFVRMPDELQAAAAISALNGKEFMGRALKIEPARSLIETQAENWLKKKKRPGTYKGGRRTRSYMMNKGSTIIQKARSQGARKPWKKKGKT